MTSLTARMDEIKKDLDSMFKEVQGMLQEVNEQLELPSGDGDHQDLVNELEEMDKVVDALDVQIEEQCLTFLALHQPVAVDLRQIIAASRIIVDLERIADVCVNISKRINGLSGTALGVAPDLITEMGARASEMLARVVQAYRQGDAKEAAKIREEDSIMDDMNRESIDAIIDQMYQQRSNFNMLLNLFSITRHFERIADHAANIAEETIYLVEGRIVRHSHPTLEK